ncbi:hypothetical protein EES44_07790 [Streptomyces sp. ADI96-15]|uniref:phage gp6-like head-tail connector protein n=1 Tax=Streptomyces sp. ADI96-15 TaxID=1522761 RepID=UPI000F54F010|nr:phage gp6-like head-tail connector protein [Streptomyces sp. ADI96-15]RPK69023.1 hypothetical protein EES44_07790 [Streptomyces sp. ADI96-15]
MALVTLAEAKRQLNLGSTDRHDVELELYIEALTPVIEGYVGAVEPRQVTQEVTACRGALTLATIPVVSVDTVTPYSGGTDLDPAALSVNVAGVVRRRDGVPIPPGPWTVTYTVGRGDPVPPTIRLAALMLLQHLWRTQTATRGPVLSGGDDFSVTESVPGFGYAVPNRVLQLLEPFKLPPGVA